MENKIQVVDLSTNKVIGRLDRVLSEFLMLTEAVWLDAADAQTLKHHADDLIGVGEKALKTLDHRMGLDKPKYRSVREYKEAAIEPYCAIYSNQLNKWMLRDTEILNRGWITDKESAAIWPEHAARRIADSLEPILHVELIHITPGPSQLEET